MAQTGFIQVDEGQLFWKYDAPMDYKNSAQSDLRTRPVLLFIHAGVSDHTLWDEQTTYCTARGWGTLRFDLLGYGQSQPSETYMRVRTPAVKHHDHVMEVIKEYALFRGREAIDEKFIAIGLSRGASMILNMPMLDLSDVRQIMRLISLCNIRTWSPEYVFFRNNSRFQELELSSEMVWEETQPLLIPRSILQLICLPSGGNADPEKLVVCAGGLGGFDFPNTPQETVMFERYDELIGSGDAENAAMMNVRIWGDGTQGKEGRLSKVVGDKLFEWCKIIAQREITGKGGSAIPAQYLPTAAARLTEIYIPTLVAWGTYDESNTNEAMKYVAQQIPGAEMKEFDTAHMMNLESPSEFNTWLEQYLNRLLL